uniref:RING-type domain-containing protein n=1 Tax=Mantoniella antarctica TaxID=81844 RepID=A0A7S0SRR0_9CHLO
MAGVRANDAGGADTDDDGVNPDAMTYEELTALGDAIGIQSKGLPQAVVDALPRSAYLGAASGEQEEQCAVCRMEFQVMASEHVLCLPACAHVYHPDCLAPWLADNKCCPICKTEIAAPAAAPP